MKINGKNSRPHLFRNRPRFWFFLAFLLVAILLTVRYERFAAKRHFGDFHVYYVTGERLWNREPIYIEEEEALTPFKYTPLAASWFALLALSPEPAAAGAWHVINLAFLALSVWLILRMIETRGANGPPPAARERTGMSILALFGISPAILHGLNSGQVGFAILFCFVLGVWFSVKGKEVAGAFFFALSATFKFLPLLVVPYFLFQKRFRLAAFSILWFLLFLFLPSIWIGWTENFASLGKIAPFLSSTVLDHVSLLDVKNQSAWAYLYRFLFYEAGLSAIREHPEWLFAAGTALFVVFYAAILAARSSKTWLIDCALLAVLTVMFNPNAWKHNFIVLILPYLLLIDAARRSNWKDWKIVSVAAIAFLFFASNRAFIGWGARFELMSLSVLCFASMLLFISLVFSRPRHPSAPES